MTSIQRQIRRKRSLPTPEFSQPVIIHDDGGYSALHPTRGWQHFSAKRTMLYAGY